MDSLGLNHAQAHVFATQELVENCIQHLRGFDRDLKSCTLVCLAWVYPGQSHLFDCIILANDRTPSFAIRSRRLLDVFRDSPHLLHLVHELRLQLDHLHEQDMDILADLSKIPFTALKRLSLCNYTLPTRDPLIISFQRLIAIQSLPQLEISCRFDSVVDFHRIFQMRGERIRNLVFRHLWLENSTEPSNLSGEALGSAAKIDSLELCDSVDIHSWLFKPCCPFDVSEVLTVGIDADATLLAELGESPAATTIETLTLNLCMSKIHDWPYQRLHLGPFVALRRLTVLSMDGENGISVTLGMLSTAPAPNLIHEITILLLELPRPQCTRFDQELVNLKDRMPYLNRVVLSCPGGGLSSLFPLLSATGLLRQ
ncbi:hypothetical protein B0H14DRAFT_3139406 [Mycena olivaceomarginata]|nr:hypothetical protein B0H14DRAFT_3139406 [Mycena olivaceomarginata]